MKKFVRYLKDLNRERNHKTKEFKRRVRLYTLSKKLKDKRNQQIDISAIKKVLFPFVDLGIGDAVCHTGIWQKLKQAGYTIQIIAEERNQILFEKIKDIDEVYIVDLNNIGALPIIETDLVVSQYSWMKRKELFNVQLLQRINYKYAISFGGWLTSPWNLMIPIIGDFHITHPQFEILKTLGISTDDLRYTLSTPSEHDNFISDYLSPYQKKRIVVLNPFASVDERSLSLTHLEKLAKLIAQQENTHVFIVGEGRKLANIKIDHPEISTCIFNSLWDTISLIRNADLVVSVDTAIVHIACALDKKIIAIYYSMLLDHNEAYQGNIIFAPTGENSHQLAFDKHHNKLSVDVIFNKTQTLLDPLPQS